MESRKSNSLLSRYRSVGFAAQGIRQLLLKEPNMRIHMIATIVVISYGCYKGLHRHQWMAVVFAIGLVWITEAINTCIEMLCDLYCKGNYHPVVKTIKDISAAAVLIAAMISMAIAFLVFIL